MIGGFRSALSSQVRLVVVAEEKAVAASLAFTSILLLEEKYRSIDGWWWDCE